MIVLTAGPAFGGDNAVKIIPVQDDLYRTVDMLFNELRLAPPSASRPWSIDEWNRVLDRLEQHRVHPGRSLSPAGEAALRSIWERLAAESRYNIARGESYQVDLSLTLALEAYGHVNQDDFPDESDWVFDYNRRAGAVLLEFEMDLHNWLYGFMNFDYRKNRYAHHEESDEARSEILYNHPFTTNLHRLEFVDFETPSRAFIAFGGDRWNLSMGRDLMRWGHGRTGNFVLNDHLDFHDMFRFVSYHDRFKFEITYLFLEHSDWLEDNEDREGELIGRRELPNPGTRMFLGHRLEFQPFPWLSLALTENVVYQHHFFDPSVLNPMFIFHNLNNRSMFNAIASAEVEAAVLPGLTLFYQYALYQAQAPLEGGSQPDAMGHMGGYRYVLPWEKGYFYHDFEGVYSDTYMYQRDEVDMKVIRRQFVIYHNFELHRDFLGYPYGGDVVVTAGTLGYHRPGVFDVQLDLFHMWRGEIGIDHDIESTSDFDLDRQAPSGTVERTFRVGLEGSWNPWHNRQSGVQDGGHPQRNRLSLFSRIDVIGITNKGNERASAVWDFQYALGASWTLR